MAASMGNTDLIIRMMATSVEMFHVGLYGVWRHFCLHLKVINDNLKEMTQVVEQ